MDKEKQKAYSKAYYAANKRKGQAYSSEKEKEPTLTKENKCIGCLNLIFGGVIGFYTCHEGHEIIDVPEKIDNRFIRHHPCATKTCPHKQINPTQPEGGIDENLRMAKRVT